MIINIIYYIEKLNMPKKKGDLTKQDYLNLIKEYKIKYKCPTGNISMSHASLKKIVENLYNSPSPVPLAAPSPVPTPAAAPKRKPKAKPTKTADEIKKEIKEIFLKMKKNSDAIFNIPESRESTKLSKKILKKNEKLKEKIINLKEELKKLKR